jgi:hypothetical protein
MLALSCESQQILVLLKEYCIARNMKNLEAYGMGTKTKKMVRMNKEDLKQLFLNP